MKPIYVIILVIVLAVAAFYGVTLYHKSHLRASIGVGAGGGQSNSIGNGEGAIPQSGDLCGGTGGNGQIISIGKNTITMKRKNGRSQIIHLANQVTIKISAGSASASLSDLKIRDRITLVGGPNPDGSFTANGVFVCSGN